MHTVPPLSYKTSWTPRKKNRVRRLLSLIFLVVIFFATKGYWGYLNSPADPDGEYKSFSIQKGESTTVVADNLERQGFIRSALVFKIDLRKSDNLVVPAGDFKISSSQSTPEIIKNLQSGSEDIKVTLLEGWRNEEMADKLSGVLGIGRAAYLSEAKEGYMFPDTYSFSPKASVDNVVNAQENNFNNKYSTNLQSKIHSLGLTSAQGMILASIVEREARSDAARVMVASILLKRFNIGMALDADSTLQYALGYSQSEKSWWRRNLAEDDKKINSPYNTYLNPGLPPGPICNPSLSSLTAVANANPSTPYLYYYHDSKGNSYYARTLDEHNANVANHP